MLDICSIDKKLKISFIYTLMLMTMPILSVYSSGISMITLGEAIFLFLCACIYSIDTQVGVNIKYTTVFIVYFVYIMSINLLINILMVNLKIESWYSFLLLSKHLLYIIILITVNLKYFNFDLSISIMRKTAVFVSLLLILQYFLYYELKINVNLFLPIIPLHVEGFDAFPLVSTNLYRPAAIFYEPAHFAQYVIFGLCFCLFPFNRKVDKNDILLAIIITISMFLSTSGIGMGLTILLWVIFIVINFKKIGLIRSMLFFSTLCILLFYSYNEISFINAAVGRIFTPNFETGAIWGRVYAIDNYMYQKHSLINFLFGYGYGYRPVSYLPSILFFLFGLGLLSVLFIIFIHIYYISISISASIKVVILISLFLFISSYGFPSYPLLFYFSFVINKKNFLLA